MTVETTNNRVNYVGDGVTINFNFSFKTFDENSIKVYEDGVLTIVSTSPTLNPDQDTSPGGAVLLGAAPNVGVIVSVTREEILSQNTDYIAGDQFPAETHERALDKLTQINQQQQDEINRSVKAGINAASGVNYELPIPQANRAIQWDSAGTGLENTDSDLDVVSAAVAASAAAAAASEAAAAISKTAADADAVQTALDVVSTAADAVQTALDVVSAASSVGLTNADVVSTAADVISTAADAVQTALDVISTAASATAAAASAAGVNLPAIVAGDALKRLRVNAGETAHELVEGNTYVTDADEPLSSTVPLSYIDFVADTWESVGETGSGEDNVWSALDAVPNGVDWIEVRVLMSAINIAGNLANSSIHTRRGGSVQGFGQTNTIASAKTYALGATAINTTNTVTTKINVTNKVFDLYMEENVGVTNFIMYLVGYGRN